MYSRHCAVVVVAILILCATTGALGAVRLPTVHDLQIGATGSTLALSHDGTLIAAETDGRLIVFNYPKGDIVQEVGQGWLPRWSPTTQRVAFYSTRSGTTQLWFWDRVGGAEQVTRLPDGIDPDFTTRFMGTGEDAMRYSWSHDGRKLIFASRVAVPHSSVPGAPLVLTGTTAPDLTTSGLCGTLPTLCATVMRLRGRELVAEVATPNEDLVSQLFVADVMSDVVTQLTKGNHDIFNPLWTRDGSAIIAASVPSAGGSSGVIMALLRSAGTARGKIVKIDPTTGSIATLVETNGSARDLNLSPREDRLAYISSDTPLAPMYVEVADLATGRAQATAWKKPIEEVQWSRDGTILVSCREAGANLIVEILPNNPQPLSIRTRSNNFEYHQAWAQDQDGALVWVDSAGAIKYLPRHTQDSVEMFRFRTADLLVGRTEKIAWVNSRGDKLRGSILYPPHYDPERRYPLIVDAYPLGGPGNYMSSMSGNQTWAAAGYVVFWPGERAPHAWMNAADSAFGAAGKGPKGFEVGLDDLLSGVDELDRRGVIDADRMCLYGHSNGGGAVSYFVTQTHRFKCAVVAAPAAVNWVSWPLIFTDGRESVIAFSGGIDFNREIDQYVKMSAVFNLYKSKTPMLIGVGDNDDPTGAIEVYNAVRQTGTEVTLVRYPDQGHLFTGDAMVDFWHRQMNFFARYLGGEPPSASVGRKN